MESVLGFIRAALCLGHRVVVGAALAPAAERPLDLPCTVAVPYRCSSSLAGVPDLYCAAICPLNS